MYLGPTAGHRYSTIKWSFYTHAGMVLIGQGFVWQVTSLTDQCGLVVKAHKCLLLFPRS